MTTALIVKPCGEIMEIVLKGRIVNNFETKGYEGELRLLYTWKTSDKVIEMYSYINGSTKNNGKLPKHKHRHPKYFGDVLFLAKTPNNKFTSFSYVDYVLLETSPN